MTARPYYRVVQTPSGWAVAHAVPGMADTYTADCEFLTRESAERECVWMLAERDRQLARERHEAALLGQRAFLPRGVWA